MRVLICGDRTWTDHLPISMLVAAVKNRGDDAAIIEGGAAGADFLARRSAGRQGVAHVQYHPGVILSFDSKYGPVRYPCDKFTDFQSNVRAIALALEALRRVDRYGVTKRGEQYTGWKALGSGLEMSSTQMTVEDAGQFLIKEGETLYTLGDLLSSREAIATCYRRAAQRLHPDAGGSVEQFQRLQEAKRLLDEVTP